MKKITLLTFILLGSIAFSQERVGLPQPKFSAIKSELRIATGWMLQPDGKWMSRKNRIPCEANADEKILVDYEGFGLGVDNFIYYQFRDLSYKDSTYTILIKKMKSGYYEYPTISRGWKNYNNIQYAVFNKSELQKALSNFQDEKTNYIEIKPILVQTIEWVFDNEELAKLRSDIVENFNNTESNNTFIFHIAPYKKKALVQFQIYNLNKTYDWYTIGFIRAGDEGMFVTNKSDLFKKCYFESSYDIFNTFIKL